MSDINNRDFDCDQLGERYVEVVGLCQKVNNSRI
jgi:hypothetical protein